MVIIITTFAKVFHGGGGVVNGNRGRVELLMNFRAAREEQDVLYPTKTGV